MKKIEKHPKCDYLAGLDEHEGPFWFDIESEVAACEKHKGYIDANLAYEPLKWIPQEELYALGTEPRSEVHGPSGGA